MNGFQNNRKFYFFCYFAYIRWTANICFMGFAYKTLKKLIFLKNQNGALCQGIYNFLWPWTQWRRLCLGYNERLHCNPKRKQSELNRDNPFQYSSITIFIALRSVLSASHDDIKSAFIILHKWMPEMCAYVYVRVSIRACNF